MWQKISIIIPTLNEAHSIVTCLQKLQALRQLGHEIVLIDGQSQDQTVELAKPYVDRLISCQKGRARQQRLGAKMATGQVFLFLHADTQLPENADQAMLLALAEGFFWGRFNVRLSGSYWAFRIIEQMMNWRSCLTQIVTGDHAIFVAKMLYLDSGGIPELALMEDIEFSRQLKRFCKPKCLSKTVITSSRRWEKNGLLKTIFFMWQLRLQYFFGTSADTLVKKYYPK